MLTTIFADSVLAGPGQTVPAVREALGTLGLDSDLAVYAMPWRLTRQQLPYVDEAVRARPDLVIIAQGGADFMKVRRPPGAGHITKAPYESAFTQWRRDQVHRARLGNRRPAVSIRTFQSSYRALVSAFVSRTDAIVVLVGPIGSRDLAPGEPEPPYRRVRTALIEELSGRDPERVLTVWPAPVLRHWEDFRSDHGHLSATGQTAIAGLLSARLSGVLRLG